MRPDAPFRAPQVATALLGALAATACLPFQPDDLFIYMRMADNVLGGQGWGFNPHVPVNTASSAAWLLVLVGVQAVSGGSALAAQAA